MGSERDDDELLSLITRRVRQLFALVTEEEEQRWLDEDPSILEVDIFGLLLRSNRKLIRLSRIVEIGLITIDPIPLGLNDPAIRYLNSYMNYVICAVGYFTQLNYGVDYCAWSLADAILNETTKLRSLLRYKNPIGLDIKTSIEPDDGVNFTINDVNSDPDNEDESFEPEYEYEYVLHEDIEPRVAIGQVHAVLNCLEALLNRLEAIIHEPPPEPLAPHQVAVETYVVNPNPLNRTQMAILEGMVYHYDNGNDTLTVGTLHESLNKNPKFNNTAKTISNNMKPLADLKYVARPFENQDYIRLTEMGRSLFPRSS
jgi:hypothetical protein